MDQPQERAAKKEIRTYNEFIYAVRAHSSVLAALTATRNPGQRHKKKGIYLFIFFIFERAGRTKGV